MSWLAFDIGGANIKVADGLGWTRSVPFPLWRESARLSAVLASLLDEAPAADHLAITMTGELCDCFSSKAEGVRHIVDAVEAVAGGRIVSVYLIDGRLVSCNEGRTTPLLAAASNWHVLATFAARFVDLHAGLLIDVGSTTTDIIPLVDMRAASLGRTDTERLIQGELVYSGVGRTPVCALVSTLQLNGIECPVAAELFATTADAYLLLEKVAEDASAAWTADGCPLTVPCAQQRLARMLCADAEDLAAGDFKKIATAIYEAQLNQLQTATNKVAAQMTEPPLSVIVSGSGEFLAQEAAKLCLPQCMVRSLAAEIGPAPSHCAPAHALAHLAREII